jgi:hypothetical protein
MNEPTPGASLHAEPGGHTETLKGIGYLPGEAKFYTFQAKSFPKNEKLYIWAWPRGSLPKEPKPIPVWVVDAAGDVDRYGGPPGPFVLLLPALAPGEALVVVLSTKDAKIRAWTILEPLPLEAKDGTCKVKAEVSGDFGAAYAVMASGFRPGEDLKIAMHWNDQSQETSSKVRDDGTWSGQVKLTVWEQESFKGRLTLAGKSCSVSLPLERRNPKRKK